ncbi:MAG: NAD(P)-binding domain-containing protein [Rhodospirillales bacterium]|nr:NAD(P)-binding domain-containing protein [Rhodospirillales bacterium]
MTSLPVAIIGAGPIGLAAAAHLRARGAEAVVLEAGPAVGHAVRQWGHVGMFTPWRWCVDRAAEALLRSTGWTAPPADDVPTGADLVTRYLEPLAAALAPAVRLGTRVTAVTRRHADKVQSAGRESLPFVLRTRGPDGRVGTLEARAVIDASGTWATPNPMGSDGLPAIGEETVADRIQTGIPDIIGTARHRHAGRTTAVVGGGHSAINVLLELAALREAAPGTEIVWIMRKARVSDAFGGEAADALAQRGALGSRARALVESGAITVRTPFRIDAVAPVAGRIRISGEQAGAPAELVADEIVVATGFRPDLSPLREIRLSLDPWLECAAALGPLIDPNLHSCGTVRPHGARELAHPDPGFYIAGMKSYGRAPTFLLATGHEQVRSIAAALTGDAAAAARVELDLPETGVCNATPALRDAAGARSGLAAAEACCAPAATACCPSEPAPAATACCTPAPAPAATACCTPAPAPAATGCCTPAQTTRRATEETLA